MLVPISIRGEEEFRRRLQVKAKGEGTSVQAVIMACLQEWLDGKRTHTEPAGPAVAKELQVYRDRLTTILCSGDTKTIAAVAADIDWYLDRLQPPGAASVHKRSRRGHEASE